MGHGKSDCAWEACGKVDANQIGQDFICLSRQGSDLYGHYEPTCVPSTYNPTKQKIEVLVRCLSDVETAGIFKGNPPVILSADFNGFFQSCKFNIAFNVDPLGLLKSAMGAAAYQDFADPDQRGFRFLDLVKPVEKQLKILVVPWMATPNDRVQLLLNNI